MARLHRKATIADFTRVVEQRNVGERKGGEKKKGNLFFALIS